MYNVTLRIIPVGSKNPTDYIYKQLKSIDSSPEIVRNTPFSELIQDVTTLITEALKTIEPTKVHDLKLFYIFADSEFAEENGFTFWIDKTDYHYLG